MEFRILCEICAEGSPGGVLPPSIDMSNGLYYCTKCYKPYKTKGGVERHYSVCQVVKNVSEEDSRARSQNDKLKPLVKEEEPKTEEKKTVFAPMGGEAPLVPPSPPKEEPPKEAPPKEEPSKEAPPKEEPPAPKAPPKEEPKTPPKEAPKAPPKEELKGGMGGVAPPKLLPPMESVLKPVQRLSFHRGGRLW